MPTVYHIKEERVLARPALARRYDGYSPQLSRVLRFHRSYGRHMPK